MHREIHFSTLTEQFELQNNNKLYAIQSIFVKIPCFYGKSSKKQVILTHLAIYHARMTLYINLNEEHITECTPCCSRFRTTVHSNVLQVSFSYIQKM